MGTLWSASCCGCPDIGTPGVELGPYALVCPLLQIFHPYNRYEGPDDSGEPTDSFWPMSVDSCWLSFHDSVIQRMEGTLHLGFYFRRPFFVGCCVFNACELSIPSMDVGTYYILLCSVIIWMTRSLVLVPLTSFSVMRTISSTHESCPWLCTQLHNRSLVLGSVTITITIIILILHAFSTHSDLVRYRSFFLSAGTDLLCITEMKHWQRSSAPNELTGFIMQLLYFSSATVWKGHNQGVDLLHCRDPSR